MKHLALYRKYRPKVFEDVIGQESITNTIINQIKSNRLSHAYLFNGPRGTGKTTCAKIISRVVNCLNPIEHNPCNNCDNCRQILSDSFLDVIEMDAASHNGVDDIRELIDGVRYPPSTGKMKVIIIDEAHMITKGAFNALLKTIEEPPSYMIFIFATTEPQKIPQTIISRCQRFDFKRIDSKKMQEYISKLANIENINISSEALQKISKYSSGAMRDALGILEKAGSSKFQSIGEIELDEIFGASSIDAENIIEALINLDISKAFTISSKLYYSGKDLTNVREDIIELLRKGLLYSAGVSNRVSEIKQSEEKFFLNVNAKDRHSFFTFALGEFIAASQNKTFENVRANFEYCLSKICLNRDLTKLEALQSKFEDIEIRLKNIENSKNEQALIIESKSNMPVNDNMVQNNLESNIGKKEKNSKLNFDMQDSYFEDMIDSFDDFEEDFDIIVEKKHSQNSFKNNVKKESVNREIKKEEKNLKPDQNKDFNEYKSVNFEQKISKPSYHKENKKITDFNINGHSWSKILEDIKAKNPFANTVICKLNPIDYSEGVLKASFPKELKALATGFESRGMSDILKQSIKEICNLDVKISII